jgi:hypothetical protein
MRRPFLTRGQIRNEITRQGQEIDPSARRTAGAIQQLAAIHQQGLEKVVETVAQAQQIIERKGPLSDTQRLQVQERTQRYLGRMRQLQDKAANALISYVKSG